MLVSAISSWLIAYLRLSQPQRGTLSPRFPDHDFPVMRTYVWPAAQTPRPPWEYPTPAELVETRLSGLERRCLGIGHRPCLAQRALSQLVRRAAYAVECTGEDFGKDPRSPDVLARYGFGAAPRRGARPVRVRPSRTGC